jgi:hypothetical protein
MNLDLTKEEREELRGIFPVGYAKIVAFRLNKKEKKPQRADEYSAKMVRDVLGGHVSDFNVNLEFLRYKKELEKEQKEFEELRKNKPKAQPVEKTQ